MSRLTAGHSLSCEERDIDRYGRIVAICLAAGTDIGEAMVHHGLALAYRRYSSDYVDTEDGAREARRGMWQGSFTEPWEWRAARRQ